MSKYLFMIEVASTRVGEVLDFVKGSGLDFDFEKMRECSDSESHNASHKWVTIPYERGYRSSDYTLYLPMAEPKPGNGAASHLDIWRVLKSICYETGEPASRAEWRERCLSNGITDQQFRDSASAMMKTQGRGVRKVRLNPNYKEG